jgi:hypothetical protein
MVKRISRYTNNVGIHFIAFCIQHVIYECIILEAYHFVKSCYKARKDKVKDRHLVEATLLTTPEVKTNFTSEPGPVLNFYNLQGDSSWVNSPSVELSINDTHYQNTNVQAVFKPTF